ncbi:MAG: phage holin family protein [Clostridia bacterium]|nr:phage holin family protein [Clostridia bacterium]
MEIFINNMGSNPVVKLFLIFLLLDILLGSIRAVKERKWNSTVGINGMLRKAGMICSVVCLGLADGVIQFNLLGFIPEQILQTLSIQKAGICEMFGIMFILYEATSILKNMALIDMPVSKKFNKKVQNLLKSMTSELENKK